MFYFVVDLHHAVIIKVVQLFLFFGIKFQLDQDFKWWKVIPTSCGSKLASLIYIYKSQRHKIKILPNTIHPFRVFLFEYFNFCLFETLASDGTVANGNVSMTACHQPSFFDQDLNNFECKLIYFWFDYVFAPCKWIIGESCCHVAQQCLHIVLRVAQDTLCTWPPQTLVGLLEPHTLDLLFIGSFT